MPALPTRLLELGVLSRKRPTSSTISFIRSTMCAAA
jgi:hypothetical protein